MRAELAERARMWLGKCLAPGCAREHEAERARQGKCRERDGKPTPQVNAITWPDRDGGVVSPSRRHVVLDGTHERVDVDGVLFGLGVLERSSKPRVMGASV